VKNAIFSENMNGIPVCLARKTENAPTQGPRKPIFGTPPWGLILLYFVSPVQRLALPRAYRLVFLFSFLSLRQYKLLSVRVTTLT